MAKIDANDAPKSDPKLDAGKEVNAKADESYLGTWRDRAAAEEGLGNMQKVMDSQGNELGSLRQQAQMMQQQLDNMQVPADEPEKPAGPDYGKKNAEIQKEMSALDSDDPGYQADLGKLIMASNQLAAQKAAQDALGMAQQEFAKVLDERDMQSTHKDFYRDNPEFNTPEMKMAIQEFLTQDTTGMHDDLSAYFAVKDQVSAGALEEAQTRIADYERRLSLKAGEEETGQVITSGQSLQQKTKQPKATGADLDKGMMEALSAAT